MLRSKSTRHSDQDNVAYKLLTSKKKKTHWLDWRYDFAWGFREEAHPQPTLRRFYQGASIYFYAEAISFVLWVSLMFSLKFGVESFVGQTYRDALRSQWSHFFTVAGMVGIVQQCKNNNSVQWWMVIYFLVAVFADLELLLEITTGKIDKTVSAAWNVLLFQSIWFVTLGTFALAWFVIWFYIIRPKDIPIPAALLQKWDQEAKDVEKTLTKERLN